MQYKRIDVDSHVQEKPDTWTSRMSRAKWGDRIPHIEEHDGKEQWIIDGERTGYLSVCPAVMPDRVTWPDRWDDIPAGVYEANGRMEYMDMDGIDCQVLYANVTGVCGERFQGREPEFEAECVRAYNDALTEEWLAVNPERFVALTVLPHSSTDLALEEVRRNARNGHRGVLLFGTPHSRGLPNYSDSYWDPLWAEVRDAQMIVSMHGSGAAPSSMRLDPFLSGTALGFSTSPTSAIISGSRGSEERRNAAALASSGFSIQPQYFANFLFSGTLDRHPDLVFVAAESGIGWLPWLLEACDHAWELGHLWDHGLPNRPSDVFHRQCYVDFWYEVSALQEYRYVIGVDRIMWETDFPHPTALWPNTQEVPGQGIRGRARRRAASNPGGEPEAGLPIGLTRGS